MVLQLPDHLIHSYTNLHKTAFIQQNRKPEVIASYSAKPEGTGSMQANVRSYSDEFAMVKVLADVLAYVAV